MSRITSYDVNAIANLSNGEMVTATIRLLMHADGETIAAVQLIRPTKEQMRRDEVEM